MTLMTPMNKPELPPEAAYWTAFCESDALAVIMRAQNYINEELISRLIIGVLSIGTNDSLVVQEIRSMNLTMLQQQQQKQQQQQQQKAQGVASV